MGRAVDLLLDSDVEHAAGVAALALAVALGCAVAFTDSEDAAKLAVIFAVSGLFLLGDLVTAALLQGAA